MNSFFEYLSGGNTSKDLSAAAEAKTEEIFNSFLARLQRESKASGGPFLYSPEGALQSYLREIEDGVLLYLVLAQFDLVHAAAAFQDSAESLGAEDGLSLKLSSFVYSTSPISRIRSSIRVMFVRASVEMFRLIDTVLQRLGDERENGHPSKLVRSVMVSQGRVLRAKMKRPMSFIFLPVIDDYTNAVAHLSMEQIRMQQSFAAEKATSQGNPAAISSSGSVKLKERNLIAIRVSRCGSTQINGDYILTSGATEFDVVEGTGPSDICFSNPAGFQLSRTERPLIKGLSTAQAQESMLDTRIFDWFIINPMLSTSYYSCSTFYESTLPPLSGWRAIGGGKLPGPFLEIAIIDPSADTLGKSGSHEGLGVAVLAKEHFTAAVKDAISSSSSSATCRALDAEILISTDTSSLKVRDRVELRRYKEEDDKAYADVLRVVKVTGESLSQVEAAERISKLRKGLAKTIKTNSSKSPKDPFESLRSRLISSIDSTYKSGIKKYMPSSDDGTPLTSEPVAALTANLLESDDFKLDLDGLKTLFDEAVKSTQSEEISKRCKERIDYFRSQLSEVSQRMIALETDCVDTILLTSPAWSADYSRQRSAAAFCLEEASILKLQKTWSLRSMVAVQIKKKSPMFSLPDFGLFSLQTVSSKPLEVLPGNFDDEELELDDRIPNIPVKSDSKLDQLNVKLPIPAEETSKPNAVVITKKLPVLQRSQLTSEVKAALRRSLVGGVKRDKVDVGNICAERVHNEGADGAECVLDDKDHVAGALAAFLEQSLSSQLQSMTSQPKPAQVNVLGAELWPPKICSYSDGDERTHYVIRVVLSDVRVQTSQGSFANFAEFQQRSGDRRSMLSYFVKTFNNHLLARTELNTLHAFTVRRDLQSIVMLYTELEGLIKNLAAFDVSLYVPPFPDAFAIGTIEEGFKSSMKALQMTEPARFLGGQPFIYNSSVHGVLGDKSSMRMKVCMESLEIYLQEVFSLMETVDDYMSDLKSVVEEDETPEVATEETATSPTGSSSWRDKQLKGLEIFLSSFGRLVGRFLQASDLKDILSLRHSSESAFPSLTPSISIPLAIDTKSCNPANDAYNIRRPCWYPYATEGLRLHLQTRDEQGGKLSLRGDDELLRRQKFKCLGCGEPLQSLFFGLDVNYQPCRVTGGLFCKRWCHSNDHRIVPHRLFLYWDTTPHRVCQQVCKFLDGIWSKPIINLLEINSLLYEGMPGLVHCRNLRDRAASVFESVLEIDAQATLLVASEVLNQQLHLVVPSEFTSLQELVGITTGETQQMLKSYTLKLTAISPESFDRSTDMEDELLQAGSSTALSGISVQSIIKNVSDLFLV